MAENRKNWLPRPRQKVYELVTETTVPYIDANLDRLGMGNTTTLGIWYKQEFNVKGYDPYVTAYAGWINPETRTPSATLAMAEAEKVFISYFRELYRQMKANLLVTNLDLEKMGFPIRPGGGHTPAPVANEAPEFNVTLLSDHRVGIDYYPLDSVRKKGKPKGQHGVEIRWSFSETPVKDANALLNSVFDTASPYTLVFSGNDQGRALYLSMRWENTRGEKGPWSRIEQTIVP